MSVTVALIQLNCTSADPIYERVPHALKLIAQAAAKAQFVVLPELWHVGAFDIEAAREHAQSINGPLVTDLAALAKQHGIWLHGGSFCEVADGSYYNTSVLFSPQGDLRGTYRKIHLFGFEVGETTLMSSGEELVVVDTPLGATGLATCYDLRFPELFRALTEGGATTFVVTSGWPASRIEHWNVLTQARAIENQAWVIACNEVGAQPGIELGGHSCVVDPKGKVVSRGGGNEEIIYVEVDPELPEKWREKFPALKDIRLR